MSDALPLFFIALGALSLSVVLYALWQSLRFLFGAERTATGEAGLSLAEREALLREKQELLTVLRDLEFERDLDKISQRDFERLDQRYRTRARHVFEELDQQLLPYREQALALLRGEATAGKTSAATSASATSPAPSRTAKASDKLACRACAQPNDPDARFCKKCGARFDSEPAKPAEPTEAAEPAEPTNTEGA